MSVWWVRVSVCLSECVCVSARICSFSAAKNHPGICSLLMWMNSEWLGFMPSLFIPTGLGVQLSHADGMICYSWAISVRQPISNWMTPNATQLGVDHPIPFHRGTFNQFQMASYFTVVITSLEYHFPAILSRLNDNNGSSLCTAPPHKPPVRRHPYAAIKHAIPDSRREFLFTFGFGLAFFEIINYLRWSEQRRRQKPTNTHTQPEIPDVSYSDNHGEDDTLCLAAGKKTD